MNLILTQLCDRSTAAGAAEVLAILTSDSGAQEVFFFFLFVFIVFIRGCHRTVGQSEVPASITIYFFDNNSSSIIASDETRTQSKNLWFVGHAL